jgi:hypothetical protein
MAKPPKKAAAKKPRAANKRKMPEQSQVRSPGVATSSKAPKVKKDRRGTPKGKGVVVGRNGGRIGNVKHVATDELKKLVETHAACGTPHWLIALEIGIAESTLYEHYRYQLDTGLLRVNARIGSLVAKQALNGDRASQSLWLKSRGGWTDKSQLVLSGPNGQPIELAAAPRNPDLKKLTDKESETYLRIQAKLEGVDLDDSA